MRKIYFILAVLVGIPLAGYAQQTRASQQSEEALRNFAQIVKQEHLFIATSDPRWPLVQQIGVRLASQARRPVPWQFVIVGDPSPNPACAGEGIVYVTTGLLDMGLDEDELAGVLGHEVAHGARQHVERSRLQHDMAANAYHSVDIDTAALRLQHDMQDKTASADRLAISNHILQARQADAAQVQHNYAVYQAHRVDNSQADEREADQIGMRYATGAGYAPDGLIRALRKLQTRNIKLGQKRAVGTSETHPPLAERIQLLETVMAGARADTAVTPRSDSSPVPAEPSADIWR